MPTLGLAATSSSGASVAAPVVTAGENRFLCFPLRFGLLRHNRRRMTQGIVTRRPGNGNRFGNGDGNRASDDSAHASTLAVAAAKHKRFLHKNFTKNPQKAITNPFLCLGCQMLFRKELGYGILRYILHGST